MMFYKRKEKISPRKSLLSFFTPSCRDYITQHAFYHLVEFWEDLPYP